MGDIDHRDAGCVVQAADLEAHFLTQMSVEIGERLVQQQNFWVHGQRAGERNTLLLPAGELARVAVGQVRRDAQW